MQETRSGRDDGEIRIGISACILGENVRFDGGHKKDSYITETLSRLVTFLPVCPEVEIGLGTPRESLRLVRSPDGVRMIATRSGRDHTSTMQRYAKQKAKEFDDLDLCGFILKKDSPSCGMERVRLYDANGVPSRTGRGLFADALMTRHPLLPVEEEGRLRDPRLRENFFERVFAYRRVKNLFAPRWTVGNLVEFHSREKMLLLAHDPVTYRELGRIVAGAKTYGRARLAKDYPEKFMTALAKMATTKKHRNVLQHISGHFKKLLDSEEKQELGGVIDDFAAGLVPLIVPVTLIRHHVRRHRLNYLEGQSYLEPHSKDLMLRNHA